MTQTVWAAYCRGEFFGEADPPGPDSLVGIYATRELALEKCWPKGDSLFVREIQVESS
jgi:hypothetical protein